MGIFKRVSGHRNTQIEGIIAMASESLGTNYECTSIFSQDHSTKKLTETVRATTIVLKLE